MGLHQGLFQSYVQMELEFTFGPVIGELFVTPLLA